MADYSNYSNKLVFFVNGRLLLQKWCCISSLDFFVANKLDITGQRQEITDPSPETFLLEHLRKNLSLTGTKLSCNAGGCGACTVTLSRLDFKGLSFAQYQFNVMPSKKAFLFSRCLDSLCNKCLFNQAGITSWLLDHNHRRTRLCEGNGTCIIVHTDDKQLKEPLLKSSIYFCLRFTGRTAPPARSFVQRPWKPMWILFTWNGHVRQFTL